VNLQSAPGGAAVEVNVWNGVACGRKTGKGGNAKLEGQLLNWLEHSGYSNQNPKSRIGFFPFFYIRLYSSMRRGSKESVPRIKVTAKSR